MCSIGCSGTQVLSALNAQDSAWLIGKYSINIIITITIIDITDASCQSCFKVIMR